MTPGYSLQEKHGYWHAVISYKDNSGKYRQKSISTRIPAVKGNKRKAELAGKELTEKWLLKQQENQRDENTITLSDAIQSYLDAKRDSVQPSTYAGYERLGKNLLLTLGEKEISKITKVDIKELTKKLMERNDTDNTAKHYITLLNGVLQWAEYLGYSLSSPGWRAEQPKIDKYHGASWYTVSEVKQLLDAAAESPIKCALHIASYLGLRRSEISGLKWNYVNLQEKTIRICEKRVQYSKVEGYMIDDSKKMKTAYSDRILPIPDDLVEVLEAEPTKEGYVCKHADGRPQNPQYLSLTFSRLLKKHGLRKIRFHDLRHTCASLLLQSGVDMKTVQIILGHGNYSTTADIYSHVDLTGKKNAMDKLNDIFS